MLTHFSLFSGIGGIDLAAEWAGFTTVGQCEFADYPTKVLEKHWPDVPRWRDIRDVTLESVRNRGIRTIDLISGGFPCQPFSVAGKQRGKEDDRYLWPEMLRVIEELRPTWVIGENVVGIVRMALDQVLFELEGKGYTSIPFIVPACGVDAQHRRERVFIVGHSQHKGWNDRADVGERGNKVDRRDPEENDRREGRLRSDIRKDGPVMADAKSRRVAKHIAKRQGTRGLSSGSWWDIEPDVGRVANGISSRVDRLKCLGNAVVPQQVYPILQAIADIESNKERGKAHG